MEKSADRGSFLPIAAGILVLAALVTAFYFISRTDLRQGEQWSRYYTFITSRPEIAEEGLDSEGISYLSLNRSSVRFNSIPEMTSISLKDVGDRFYPEDPRFDPYMRKVSNLFYGTFEGQERSLVYVEKDGLSPFALYLLMNSLYDDGDYWKISGFDPYLYIIPLSLFLLFSLFISLITKETRYSAYIALAAWTPFVFLFGPVSLAAACLVHSMASSKFRFPILLPVGVAFGIVHYLQIGFFDPFFFPLLLLGYTGASLFYSGAKKQIKKSGLQVDGKSKKWRRKKIRFTRPEHQLFEPVRIMDSRGKRPVVVASEPDVSFSIPARVAVVLFILAGTVFAIVQKNPDVHIIPLPGEQVRRPWSLSSTGETFDAGQFISPADYITHIAYQEGLLYRSSWTYPTSDSPLLYPVFETEEDTISKSYEIIGDYNEKWFDNQISLLKNDNPAKLLFSTEGPVNVEKKPDQPISPSFVLLKISFSVLLLLLLFFSDRKKINYTSLSVRKKLLRRNEQVA